MGGGMARKDQSPDGNGLPALRKLLALLYFKPLDTGMGCGTDVKECQLVGLAELFAPNV